MQEQEVDLFPCYSKPLKDYLNKQGFIYKITGLSIETHKQFWVFIRTEQFNNALTKWGVTNPKG
jgi:hypothetical protein